MRKTLRQITNYPDPNQLYDELMQSSGWLYKTNKELYLRRDRALVSILYLGDFRSQEVIPLITENFELKGSHLLVKGVKVGKKKRLEYREAKFPLEGERACFTDLVLKYVDHLKPKQRLFEWSTEVKTFELKSKHDYVLKDGTIKHRRSVQMVGTKRAWQIVHALLPQYTQHWLRAFGYNFDYDHMDHDIFAVSDKTKADPRSLTQYLRKRYDKYPVR